MGPRKLLTSDSIRETMMECLCTDWASICWHYDDVIMTMLASQITSLTVVYSIVYSGVNQRKHQSSASLAFVREIHRGPVNFPHKWPVTRKMFPFDDVIMARYADQCIFLFIWANLHGLKMDYYSRKTKYIISISCPRCFYAQISKGMWIGHCCFIELLITYYAVSRLAFVVVQEV